MKYLNLLLLITFFSCSNSAVQQELEKAKQQLVEAQAVIKNLEEQIEPEGDLVHIVLLKLKPDADQAALIVELKKMEGIKEVMELEVGPFEDLGDARALSDYNMIMQMSFKDQTAYETYQKHEIHLNLKESLGPYLAGPPATYDYMVK